MLSEVALAATEPTAAAGDHGKLCSRFAPKQVGYDLMP